MRLDYEFEELNIQILNLERFQPYDIDVKKLKTGILQNLLIDYTFIH